jgi:hypothetical protein
MLEVTPPGGLDPAARYADRAVRIVRGYPHMAVGLLEITTYETARGPYHTERILHPAWEAIQAAIVRLDRCFYPFIFLYKDAGAPEDSVPDFEVVGSDNAYAVVIRSGDEELWLQNPGAGDEEIDVWVSDQGASIPARKVCPLLGEVLLAARYFHEHGKPNPESTWG